MEKTVKLEAGVHERLSLYKHGQGCKTLSEAVDRLLARVEKD